MLNKRFQISKEIGRFKYFVNNLFKRKEFDFNEEDYSNYAFFHKNGMIAKTEAIKKLIRDYTLDRFVSKGQGSLVMLDVGCGTGEIDELIQCDFSKIVGVDSSIESVRKATIRKLNNGKFLVCGAEKLCFTNCVFDMVLLVNILHHSFKSSAPIIQESYRVLKKDGLMVIFELNPLNPLQMIWFYLFNPIDRKAHMISPRYLKRIVKEITGGLVTVRPLISSLCFEYMVVYSKNN